MFKSKIWDKFTEFTFLKLWNLPSEMREIWKFQKMNEVNFPCISRINMWNGIEMLLKLFLEWENNGGKFQNNAIKTSNKFHSAM